MKNRKNFLVIGNPIKHSLSPLLHNYWFQKNKINCEYKKLKINQSEIKKILTKVRKKEIEGINVTIPFKRSIIRHLDVLKGDALKTSSVNTVYLYKKKLVGENTDVYGFSSGVIKKVTSRIKTAGIIGAGGVTSSIILALIQKEVKKIYITNRTFSKLKIFKKKFKKIVYPIKWDERYKLFGDAQILIKVRKKEIEGINVTIPFKSSIIRHLDVLKGDALCWRACACHMQCMFRKLSPSTNTGHQLLRS